MATRDIRVGDCDTGADGGGDITVCHEKTNPEGREITVCIDCSNPPEIGITGEDEPSVGDQYSVSGGVAPYRWSFDGGTIDSTGKITAITSCGGSDGNGAVGSVTVTDACGQTKSIIVRLPGGYWGNYTRISYSSSSSNGYEERVIGSIKSKWSVQINAPNDNLYSGCNDAPEVYSTACINIATGAATITNGGTYAGVSCGDSPPWGGDGFVCMGRRSLITYDWIC